MQDNLEWSVEDTGVNFATVYSNEYYYGLVEGTGKMVVHQHINRRQLENPDRPYIFTERFIYSE